MYQKLTYFCEANSNLQRQKELQIFIYIQLLVEASLPFSVSVMWNPFSAASIQICMHDRHIQWPSNCQQTLCICVNRYLFRSAAEENRCPETQRLLGGTSLTVRSRWPCLVDDVSTGVISPVVPIKYQNNFFHAHNISNPGRLASWHLMSSRFVWRSLG